LLNVRVLIMNSFSSTVEVVTVTYTQIRREAMGIQFLTQCLTDKPLAGAHD